MGGKGLLPAFWSVVDRFGSGGGGGPGATTVRGHRILSSSASSLSDHNLPMHHKRSLSFKRRASDLINGLGSTIGSGAGDEAASERGRRDSNIKAGRKPSLIPGTVLGIEDSDPIWGRTARKVDRWKLVRIGAWICAFFYVLRLIVVYNSEKAFNARTYLTGNAFDSFVHEPEAETGPFIPTTSFLQREDLPTSSPPPSFFALRPPSDLVEKLDACASYCTGKMPPKKEEKWYDTPEQLQQDLDVVFGPPSPVSHLYPHNFPYQIRDTDQFALASIISIRARQMSLSLPQPSSGLNTSDFILIDLDTLNMARCFSCSHRENLPTPNHHHDLRRTTVDWLRETIEEHKNRRSYPSLVLTLAMIDHDYEGNILNHEMEDLMMDSVIVLGIEREPWAAPSRLRWFRQMPYPAAFHLGKKKGMSGMMRRKELAKWLLEGDRNHVVSFAGKKQPNSPKSGKGPQNGFLIRDRLSSTLSAHAEMNDSRLSLLISHPGTQKHPFLLAAHTAMLNSTFCLQPPGDSPTRKGFFESILLGCIPVVFRRGTYDKVFPSSLGDDLMWDEGVALYVSEEMIVRGGVDIVEHLASIPLEEVRRRQMEIAGLAGRIQYEAPELDSWDLLRRAGRGGSEWSEDAFGMMLRELQEIKRLGSRKEY